MKITYKPNPLETIIELDEHEQRDLWHKIRFERMTDMLFSVHYELTCKKDGPDIEAIKREVDPDYYLNEDDSTSGKSKLDKSCDESLAHYLEELAGSHVGDCTCFPMSCSKCHAEGLIGIDTIKGLGKHSADKIYHAFVYKEGEIWKYRNIDEALEILKSYNPTPQPGSGWEKVGGFFSHVPRWKEEARLAYEWLLNYKNTVLDEQDKLTVSTS